MPEVNIPRDVLGMKEVDVDVVAPASDNHRRSWSDPAQAETLDLLKKSIVEEGLLQDIVITPILLVPDNIREASMRHAKSLNSKFKSGAKWVFLIVSGERRWRAWLSIRRAMGDKIPCKIIIFPDDFSRRKAMLAENINREDLNPMEKAKALMDMWEEMYRKDPKARQKDVAEELNMRPSEVSKLLGLLNVSPVIQEAVAKKEVSVSDAHELKNLDGREAKKFINRRPKMSGERFRRAVRTAAGKDVSATVVSQALPDGFKKKDIIKLVFPGGRPPGCNCNFCNNVCVLRTGK